MTPVGGVFGASQVSQPSFVQATIDAQTRTTQRRIARPLGPREDLCSYALRSSINNTPVAALLLRSPLFCWAPGGQTPHRTAPFGKPQCNAIENPFPMARRREKTRRQQHQLDWQPFFNELAQESVQSNHCKKLQYIRIEVRNLGSAHDSNLVDPASSHTLVSKIKPCMSKYKRFIR